MSDWCRRLYTHDIVITADESNMLNHQLSFLAGFLSCVPRDKVPAPFRRYVERKLFAQPHSDDGIAKLAILPLRRLESALLEKGFDAVICVPKEVEKFKAKVWAVSAMDPFGIGPASSTMAGLSGGREPYNKWYFEMLMRRIRANNPHAKILVGGSGAWEFDVFPTEPKRLSIDCVVQGEVENIVEDLFRRALAGGLPEKVVGEPAVKIPTMRGPCYWGLTEIGRGCDRLCQFCDPSMKEFRWFSYEQIAAETQINAKSPLTDQICLLSEDVLRYGTKVGEWVPNDKVVKLIKMVNSIAKQNHKLITFTHATIAAAASAPDILKQIAEELELGRNNLSGFQVGLETGSPRLVEKYARNKAKPWSPEQWPEVAERGFAAMTENNFIPIATLVMGFEDETDDDVIKTIELVERLRSYPSMIVPLFFVPLGVLQQKRAFDRKQLTAARKDLFIVCAEHTTRWSKKFAEWAGGVSEVDKFILYIGWACIFEVLKALKRENEKISKIKLLGILLRESASYFFNQKIKRSSPQKSPSLNVA